MTPDWLVVFDELDQLDTSARIFQLAKSDRSTIVVYPGVEGGTTLPSSDVLVALGKSIEGLGQNAKALKEAARAWILAEQVQDIVIYGAQRIRGSEDLFDGVPCRIWAVTPSKNYADQLLNDRGRIHSIDELFEALETSVTSTDMPVSEKSFPRVPYDEFFTFLSSSRELHEPGPELNLIVKTFYQAYRGARRLAVAKEASSYGVKAHVHQQMVRAPCIRSAVCRLRGIQASLFDQWCYLRVHLLGTWSLWNSDSEKGDRGEIATVCRQGIDSLPGVAVSLAHLTEFTAREACGLITDYSEDGSSFTLQSRSISVPSELQAFFRHQFPGEAPAALFESLSNKEHLVPTALERLLARVELDSTVKFSASNGTEPQFFRHLELNRLQRFPNPEEALAII